MAALEWSLFIGYNNGTRLGARSDEPSPPLPPTALSKRLAIVRAVFSAPSLAATAVVFGVLTAALVVVRPEQWMVERVVFEGQQRATIAELRHLADLPNGTNPLLVRPEAVAASLQRHPWVGHARVTLELPSTVRVSIDEHVPEALLHRDGRLFYVGAEGTAFLPALPGDADYPHLTGFDGPATRAHPDLPATAVRAALTLMDGLVSRGLVARDDLSEVAFDVNTGLLVVAGPARLRFAHDHHEASLDRLAALVSRGVRLDVPQEIDLAPSTVAIVRPLQTTASLP